MTPEIATLALRDLEYIVAIAEHKNFRIASKACSVSQPALSTQIKKVELALDIQIFERTNREVLITDVGIRIVEQCRIILEELENLGSIARGANKPLQGSFRLGVIPSLAPYLLPSLQIPLNDRFPELDLVLREGSTPSLLEALRVGKVDAVLSSYPIPKSSGNFTTIPLFSEPLRAMLHVEDPLSSQQTVRVQDLDTSQMVFLDEHFSLTDETHAITTVTGSDLPTKETHTTTIEAMCIMVALSKRQAIIPYLATDAPRKTVNLAFRSFESPEPTRTIALSWRPRYSGYDALTSFADLVCQVALTEYPILQAVEDELQF